MGLSLKKILGEITGGGARKRREKDLEKGIGEFAEETRGSAAYLQNFLKNLLEESGRKASGLETTRTGRQQDLTRLIGELGQRETGQREALLQNLRGGIESAFGEFGGGAQTVEDKLRQAIAASLGETETGLEDVLGRKESGIQNALNQYLSGQFAQELPEIESALGSRGLSIRGGTASEALGQQLAKLGGVRFQTLSDLARERAGATEENILREARIKQALEGETFGTGREDLLNRLQQMLGLGQEQAQITREDQLRGGQREFEDYLRSLGIAREEELGEKQFQYGLRGQQLPLEQMIKQMALLPFQQRLGLQEQQLAGAQKREEAITKAFGKVAGSVFGMFGPKFGPVGKNIGSNEFGRIRGKVPSLPRYTDAPVY